MLLIIGITGHSGKYLLQELIDNPPNFEKIRVSVRPKSHVSLLNNCNLAIEQFVGDIEDESFLNEIMQGVDTLIHIAGIRYSIKLINAAISNNISRMILVHTTGVYSKYKSASQEYKQIDNEIHELAKKNNIDLTILRPTMIYGSVNDRNVVKFIKLVDKFKIVPVVNRAKYELQPVHAKDLGKAYYDVLVNPQSTANKDYNLSGKNPIMLIDMLKEIEKNLGIKRKYFNVPFPIAYVGSWIIYLLTLTKFDYREKVQRLCEPRVFPHEDAINDFGYNPVAFEDGIIGEVKDYLNLK